MNWVPFQFSGTRNTAKHPIFKILEIRTNSYQRIVILTGGVVHIFYSEQHKPVLQP